MNKVSRAEWGARPPKSKPLRINTLNATGHWEGTAMGSFPHSSCATKVRVIQNYHMDTQGWNDIAYNFLVCPHGYCFVGRDHYVRSSANGTNHANGQSEAVCFLGGIGDPFPIEAERTFSEIMYEISSEHYCHNNWFNTMCPGPEICGEIKNGYPRVKQQPPTTPTEDDELPLHIIQGDGPGWFVTDQVHKRLIWSPDEAARIVFRTRSAGGKIMCTDQNGPIKYAQEDVDAIPTVNA